MSKIAIVLTFALFLLEHFRTFCFLSRFCSLYFSCVKTQLCSCCWSLVLWTQTLVWVHRTVGEFLVGRAGEHSLFPEVRGQIAVSIGDGTQSGRGVGARWPCSTWQRCSSYWFQPATAAASWTWELRWCQCLWGQTSDTPTQMYWRKATVALLQGLVWCLQILLPSASLHPKREVLG